jgi:putative NADH-flavin reductase
MKLTIIAPTGAVGRQLLAQALDAHHDVTAVARNPAKLPPDVLATRDARVVTSDLADPDPQVLETTPIRSVRPWGAPALISAGCWRTRRAGPRR